MEALPVCNVLLNFVATNVQGINNDDHDDDDDDDNVCTSVIAYLKAEEELPQDEPSHCAVCSMSGSI
jgi:hypothetical protein